MDKGFSKGFYKKILWRECKLEDWLKASNMFIIVDFQYCKGDHLGLHEQNKGVRGGC